MALRAPAAPVPSPGTSVAPSSRPRGFSLIEVLIAATVLVLAAMMGVMHVVSGSAHVDWARDRAFAREKAISILDELRSFVESGDGEIASDLDGFDDGISHSPVLTITSDPDTPGTFVAPDHPTSGNIQDVGAWRFYRRITVKPYGTSEARDLRYVTVKVFRAHAGEEPPGVQLAEASSIVRTIADSHPSTHVYDVYLLAIDNVPGWWVAMDAVRPFMESALTDLQNRNRGVEFRTHWITKLGYGRDEEYAPYTNESHVSTDTTPWTYVYPGRLPDGEAAARYYVPGRFSGRTNLDGTTEPVFNHDYVQSEPYTDVDGSGTYDEGEPYTDTDADGQWDAGNPLPHAIADMHNHCLRWPEADERFRARRAAGLEPELTWRLLLDRMLTTPDEFHNAILINMHGELLPMPPVRNVSDPAKDPERRPGWRVVTHPERLRPRRVTGDDGASDTPRWRIYAYKSEFGDNEVTTSQAEPYLDANRNGGYDDGEAFEDWNGNGAWDAGLPISLVIRDMDLASAPNAGSNPTLRILRLAGGVDANADGAVDPYEDWTEARCYPEPYEDTNGDSRRQVQEPFLDLNGNGTRDADEPWQEIDGDGAWTAASEALEDGDGDGVFDDARPAETFTDTNGNGAWDAAEPYWDLDGDGAWTPPTTPVSPWQAWNPAYYGNPAATASYVASYGEPFLDIDGSGGWTGAEPFYDADQDGVRDGGFERGEMWFSITGLSSPTRTVLALHGTPLETPYLADTKRGLPATARLYDYDYVPCPTPKTAGGADRFENDLYTEDAKAPKNTARWVVELPLASIRSSLASSPGSFDGDAADRILTVETRLGRDLATGTLWPARRDPQNLSVTHAYFYGDVDDVPYSERYQFQGDPRHSPYADTDARGATAPHGYNWYFDDFSGGGKNASGAWKAFDAARLDDGWLSRGGGSDVPRFLAWLRNALTATSAVFTTMTGFDTYYLSLGGDVGWDSSNAFPSSVPVDGTPYGLSTAAYENSIISSPGTPSIAGSVKLVRGHAGSDGGLRDGGRWWSKPWLGELFEDRTYVTQWEPWGNLRATVTPVDGGYKLVKRSAVPSAQQPSGTVLVDLPSWLGSEGCTSLFNVGSSSRTFHHQFEDGSVGKLVDEGVDLPERFSFPLPEVVPASRPFGVACNRDGGLGPEFDYTEVYPRCSAAALATFYDHENGEMSSGVLKLTRPGARGGSAYLVVNGLDRAIENGTSLLARYSVVALLQGFLAAGDPNEFDRVKQLPKVTVESPTIVTELENPTVVTVRWSTLWARWDGRSYTNDFPDGFAEDDSELVYVPLYSPDGGRTWRNMLDDEEAEPGAPPLTEGGGFDASKMLPDTQPGENETYLWLTPSQSFPEGSYLVRIEAYRASEHLHYAYHQEKIYVER